MPPETETEVTPPPPSSSSSSPYHPAFTVTNIKGTFPIVLDQEEGQYESWAEYFTIHACAYNVLDHINSTVSRPPKISDSVWMRLDAIVKQWIYATISKDLASTIIKPGATAIELWNRLKEFFHDNKESRAVYLTEQFNLVKLENFSSMADYCKQIKLLADQLANVDSPVSEKQMVLRLIAGLPKGGEYDTVATMIHQSKPLPSFSEARSRLILEETRRSKQEDSTETALVTSTPPNTTSSSTIASPSTNSQSTQHYSGGRGGRGGRGGGRGGRGGRGRGRGRGGGRTFYNNNNSSNSSYSQSYNNPSSQPNYFGPPQYWTRPSQPWQQSSWASPPCPYPTQSHRPQQGILGPPPRGPQQAYHTQSEYGPVMTPTELGHAYNSMSLQPPDDQWYLDSGASTHLTHNSGSQYGDSSHEVQ